MKSSNTSCFNFAIAQWANRYRQVVLGVLVGISQNLRYRWIPLIVPVNLEAKKVRAYCTGLIRLAKMSPRCPFLYLISILE